MGTFMGQMGRGEYDENEKAESIAMAKRAPKRTSAKTIEALTHDEAKRKNIPTAEYQSVIQKEEEKPKTIKYPRNTDLDPQQQRSRCLGEETSGPSQSPDQWHQNARDP
jgi:hypothetical protein